MLDLKNVVIVITYISLLASCSSYTGQWGRHQSFADFQQKNVEGRDYKIRSRHKPGRPMVMAIHGGKIEVGTSELLYSVVEGDYSYYELEAKVAPDYDKSILQSGYLHLTSHKFDDPALLKIARQTKKCLSLHGYPAKKTGVDFCVGGGNEELRKNLVEALEREFPLLSSCELCCPPYLGLHDNNVVNQCLNKGAQIEMSPKVRALIINRPKFKSKLGKILKKNLN